MAFCNMKNPPEYTTEVRKWDRETRADGQGMAVEIEQLFNNTYYNKTNKVDKNGGDISDTIVETDNISEEFPDLAAKEITKTFLSKVKKSLNDWKNFKDGIITLGMLTNQYENNVNKIPTSALVYTLKQTVDRLNNSNIVETGTYGYWTYVKYANRRLTATYVKPYTINSWTFNILYWTPVSIDHLPIATSVRTSKYQFLNSVRAVITAETDAYTFYALSTGGQTISGTVTGYLEGTW